MTDLTIVLDRTSSIPLFMQLYTHIKNEITKGNFEPDEKLPSKRKLSDFLQCSQNTVQAAYDQLIDEGYIASRPKSGHYVADLQGIVSIGLARPKAPDNSHHHKQYAYDFAHQGVDYQCFPFSVWRKLTREAIQSNDRDLMRAGHPQGDPDLRVSLARYLHHSRGVVCAPEQIVVSSGVEFLLMLLIQLFSKTTVYAFENPGYEKLSMIFHANRVKAVAVPLDRLGLLPDELEGSGADIACITPAHQFPTGCIMPVSRRLQLLKWAYEKPDRYLIEDDYDSEFRYSGQPIPSLQSLDQKGQVIYMGAFSKSLSPALRISYAVLPEELLRRYHELLGFYLCPVPTFVQKTLRAFIDNGHFERHLNRVRGLYRQKREALVKAIHDVIPTAEITGATAGLHIVLHIHNGMCETELISSAESLHVRVYGMSRFFTVLKECERETAIFEQQKEEGTVLLGFATLPLEEIPCAVARLGSAWSGSYPPHPS